MKTTFGEIVRVRPADRKAREKMTPEEKEERRSARKAAQEFAKQAERARYRPCPFCRGENTNYVNNGGVSQDWVQCFDCGSTGPFATGKDQAIEFWNEGIPLPKQD